VPQEVRPLVDAVNHHVERSEHLARNQRQFLDDASHQLRTPLAVLRTQVDYAQREPDPAQVREALGAMRHGVDRAARLVNQLLALARVNHAESSPDAVDCIDLVALVEEVGRTLLPEARRKQQDFGLVVGCGKLAVSGSETLLREAITNLVDNAIRHAPEHGHITLTAARTGDEAWIEVADDGPGIPPEERPHIGERFRRGQRASESGDVAGAGLGLAITKAIVLQHHGRIEVEEGPAGA
jgi:two-component system, OmpR family, sensor histidine kinase TctE